VARRLLAIPILPENQTLISLPKTDFAKREKRNPNFSAKTDFATKFVEFK
jgi:hypothetical protein